MTFVALVAHWIGLSAPGSFGRSEILWLSAGIVVLLIAFLYRVDDVQGLRSLGLRVAAAYRGAAILTLNTIVLLVFLEVAATGVVKIWNLSLKPADPEVAHPREKVSYYTSQDWAAQYWAEYKSSAQERYHPYVIWRRAPFTGKTINIDQHGIRLTPGADCSANSYRVFAFGGSTMWGTGSPDWGTIPAHLQVGLEALRGKPICVVNFGESGFVSTQEVIELLMQLESGNAPHLVLFYDGINDVYTAYQSGRAGVHENVDQIAAKLEGSARIRSGIKPAALFVQWLETSSTFSSFKSLVSKLGLGPQTSPKLLTYETMGIDVATLSDSVVQNYLVNYKIVSILAQEYGFDFFFFWQPTITSGEKPLTREEQDMTRGTDPAERKLYDSVYRIIEQESPKYKNIYYMARIFDEYKSLIFIDGAHVTPEGNRLIAQKMLQAIMYRNPG
jgi:lysophospholipase L1-like esterase